MDASNRNRRERLRARRGLLVGRTLGGRGVAYRLHVVNRGHELHELTAPDFFKTVEMRNPEALNREHTELVLQPGDQKDLYFVAKRPGRYDMRCADHDWAGMTGDIFVK
jgi:uncharacterized cupredoxin-like copper-binding protein